MTRRGLVVAVCGWLVAISSVSAQKPAPPEALFRAVADAMPEYTDFLTVDELQDALVKLQREHPTLVELRTVGHSANGVPITECIIGRGRHHALLFGFPHPNEPIGSMMLHYLTRVLVENEALRNHFDVTWHIVLCAEPDKARLNEGWFKGPHNVTKYARHFYRPPGYQQVEWTFPITYKKYAFTTPIPEARALMAIIDRQPLAFSFGLHNSGFGGVYYYWSHDMPGLYPSLYAHIARLGLPLHLGEPEVPWGERLDGRAMFRMIYVTDEYDYLEKYSKTPPEQVMKAGASSDDYVKAKYQALTVNCELPYFYDPRIEDTTPSSMSRADVARRSLAQQRERLATLRGAYDRVSSLLTTPSPFRDSIEETLRATEPRLAAEERAIGTDAGYARLATVAEQWDALSLRRFYDLLGLGQFVRMLEYEQQTRGGAAPPELAHALADAKATFEGTAADVERDLTYTVVPIKKLATVQLLTAFYALDAIQRTAMVPTITRSPGSAASPATTPSHHPVSGTWRWSTGLR